MNKQWDKSFFKIIQHILMTEWDPIGIKDFINTEDEYDPYAMQVYSQLVAGSDADQIAEYLTETEYGKMGLGSGTERRPASERLPIAKHLIAELEKFKARPPGGMVAHKIGKTGRIRNGPHADFSIRVQYDGKDTGGYFILIERVEPPESYDDWVRSLSDLEKYFVDVESWNIEWPDPGPLPTIPPT